MHSEKGRSFSKGAHVKIHVLSLSQVIIGIPSAVVEQPHAGRLAKLEGAAGFTLQRALDVVLHVQG